MYWTDRGKIMRAWMDGTNSSVQVFITDSSIGGWLAGLTIDYLTERIYWTGAVIKYASLNDPQVRSIGRNTRSNLIVSLAVYKVGVIKH